MHITPVQVCHSTTTSQNTKIIQKKVLTNTIIHLTRGNTDYINMHITFYIPHVQRTYPQGSFHQGLCQLLQKETYNPVR